MRHRKAGDSHPRASRLPFGLSSFLGLPSSQNKVRFQALEVGMADIDNRLLVRRLRAVVESAQEGGASDDQWDEALSVYEATDWEDAALQEAFDLQDSEHMAIRVRDWDSEGQPLPPPDRAILKRALKAFRKRIKLQKLDDESKMGGGPFSGGRSSRIAAIQPPQQYPAEVWDELARRGRLRDEGDGFYDLAEDS